MTNKPDPPRETLDYFCAECGKSSPHNIHDEANLDGHPFVSRRPAPSPRETPPQRITDIEHLAYSILHGTFNPDSPGGCSCGLCRAIREKMDELCKEEAARFYAEHYPPPGGLL